MCKTVELLIIWIAVSMLFKKTYINVAVREFEPAPLGNS